MNRKLLLLPVALGLGLLSFGVVGIAVARITGVGRFYSVPFGMMTVNEMDLLMSAATWVTLWLLILSRVWIEKASDKER